MEKEVQKALLVEEFIAEITSHIQKIINVDDSDDEPAVGDQVLASYQRLLTSAVNVEASTHEKRKIESIVHVRIIGEI